MTREGAPALVRTRPRPPIRIVHLGLGNFFRAHQAWYTHHASDGEAWGIAAFCGRSSEPAERLNRQDATYTLDIREPSGDRYEVIESIGTAFANADRQAWARCWADPAVVLATMTITEAGYCRTPDGRLQHTDPRIQQDIAVLGQGHGERTVTAPGQLVAGLMARRAAEAGPITLVSCDNLPSNGAALRSVLLELADLVDEGLAAWIDAQAQFADTLVDRITPAVSPADHVRIVRDLGRPDAAPVVTEPFTEWVLQGEFAPGRPRWEAAGARFVPSVVPLRARKLALLNGAHSLMAYAAPLLGHQTVSSAIGSEVVLAWVEEWWDEACRHLDLPGAELQDYRSQLIERFANPAIEHRLEQIAADGSLKLPVRILPTLHAERSAARMPIGAARALAAWTVQLGRASLPADPRRDEFIALADAEAGQAVPAVLTALDPPLGDDTELIAAVVDLARELQSR